MPESKDGPVQRLLEWLDPHLKRIPFWTPFKVLVLWVLGLAPLWQHVVLILSLIIAVWQFGLWARRVNRMQALMHGTLTTAVEANAQQYKGLEAFLLSGLSGRLPKLTPTSEVTAPIKEVERLLASTPASPNFDSLVSLLEIDQDDPPIRNQHLRMKAEAPFVYVPGFLLRRKDASMRNLQHETVLGLLTENPAIAFDLAASTRAYPALRRLEYKTINGLSIVQAYIITDSGIMLIRQSGVQNQRDHYEGGFRKNVYFPEKPYFRDTVSADDDMNTFQHVTQPYFDLAGNGLVETACHKLQYPGDRDAVLCVDLKLQNDAMDYVGSRLASIHAVSKWVDCKILPDPSCPDLPWLDIQLKDSSTNSDKSDILGQIAFPKVASGGGDLYGKPWRSRLLDWVVAHYMDDGERTPHILEFTLPFAASTSDDEKKLRFLWARIDLDELRNENLAHVGTAAFALCIFVTILFNVLLDYHARVRLQLELLNTMVLVMDKASTPFAWVDSKNCFVKTNEAFYKLLGYSSFEELQMVSPNQKRMIKDLMTPSSKKKYEDLLEASKRGETTPSFRVLMKTNDDKRLNVLIRGEKVPFPSVTLNELPHRFGVILQSKPAAQGEPDPPAD